MRPVAIVGTNKFSRSLIDWELDADYWVFNEVAGLDWPKRVDGVFQMHIPALFRNKKNVNFKDHYEWLKKEHPYPIWMQEVYPDIPSSVKYPLEEISAEFLKDKLVTEDGETIDLFTSTPAYALAMAIYQKRSPIYLFGIEMGSNTEFFRQRPGFYFWSGIAAGRGLKLVRRNKSLLFSERIYGYKGEMMIQKQEIELSLNHYMEMLEKEKAKMFESKGGTQKLLEAIFASSNQEDAKRVAQLFIDSMNETLDASYHYGQICGAVEENKRYLSEINALIDSAGGERALEMMLAGEKEA
jgi:hypothetical protein